MAMNSIGLETLRLGVNNLRLHKLRSLLTSLGIILGVAAVICMLSVTEGASADEMRLIELLGTKNIIVNSVKPQQAAQSSGKSRARMTEYGITRDDVAMIRETIPHVAHVVPLKTVAYRAHNSAKQATLEVVGTTPEFFEVVNITIAEGRRLGYEDSDGRKNTCVIGDAVRTALFPLSDPIGETLLVERHPTSIPFTVVGVLADVETAGTPERGVQQRDLNNEILIPFSTAMSQFGEITRKSDSGSREYLKIQYSGLYITATEIDAVEAVSEMVKRVLEKNHIKKDYEVKVPLARLKLAEQKERNSKLTLGFIAGISLLVGGIGIMNIMLATVTERTREIGIRRALGAKRSSITLQFLVETIVLSTTGGLAGVALGVAGANIVTKLASWDTIVSGWSVAISFGLSVLVGVVSGLYPAMSAAKLDPIDALRYE